MIQLFKTMSRPLSLLPYIALPLLFSACEKEEGGDTQYYFRAKLNGEEKNFLHSASFQGGGNDGRWEHIIIGGSEAPVNYEEDQKNWPPSFVIDMWNEGGTFEIGEHTSSPETPADTQSPLDFSMDGEYHPELTYQFDQRDIGYFTFNITELSKEKGIKGTFEGFISNENNVNETIEITDGELYLPMDDVVN